MNSTALEIAKKLNGRVEGNGQVQLNKLSKLEEARKGSISFLANPKYISFLENTRASAILIPNEFQCKLSTIFKYKFNCLYEVLSQNSKSKN